MAREDDTVPSIPSLEPYSSARGLTVWVDPALLREGVLVAFSERRGGASAPPFDSLNLASHVGDEPAAVDENRRLLLESLGIARMRERLVTAEQVHGEHIACIDDADAGAGAFAGGLPPVSSADALLTATPDLPLLMCYADCVPVVLVAPGPRRAVCVVHAGWRGALAHLPGAAVRAVCEYSRCPASEVTAYLGPHIKACCYEVGERILSHFRNNFDTIGAVEGRLDLGAVVRESLTREGVPLERIAEVGLCTRDHTDRFFSYRADPLTGRHGALAVIAEGE